MVNHIIGAGPTGLTLASLLPGKNVVYEKASKAGGCHAIFNIPERTEHSPKMYNTNFKKTLKLLKGILEYEITEDVTDASMYYSIVDIGMVSLYTRYVAGYLDPKQKLSEKHRLAFKDLLYLIESVDSSEWTYDKFFKIFTYNYNAKTFQPTNDFCDEWKKKLQSDGVVFYMNKKISLRTPDLYTQLKFWKRGDKIFFCGPIKQLYASLGREIPEMYSHMVYKEKMSYTLVYKKTKTFNNMPKWYELENAKKHGIVYIEKPSINTDFIVLLAICNKNQYTPFDISHILTRDGLPPMYTYKECPYSFDGNSNFGINVPTNFGHFTYLNHSNGLSDYPFCTIESSIQNVKAYLKQNK